jgi:Uma2 family endonuclease
MSPSVPDPLPTTAPPPLLYDADGIPYPDLDALITEDGAPVDNLFVEKQYRLLTDPLISSWTPPGENKRFLVATDVGVFYNAGEPALAPDCFLSIGVAPGANLRAKENRSYFIWLVGKPPDVVIEIVSDKRGGEEDHNKDAYARMGVLFYVIFDPGDVLKGGVLRAGALTRRKYTPIDPHWLAEVGVGLTLWQGAFEGYSDTWLRWCDENGRPIPTGAERAEEAKQTIERLAAQLRALGVNPEV